MTAHIKAWNEEYKSNIWKGPYSLELLDSCCKKGLVLDAGCGSGKYSLPLRRRGFDVVAMDVSLNALKLARESSKNAKLDIDFLAANIYQMPFSDASFDAVLCYGVLQHLLLKERELAISEFWRILRENGLLFVEVFGEDDMRYGGIEVEPNTFARKSGIVYHYFNKEELGDLLKGYSCKIVELRKEKWFEGKSYTRHMISAVARKSSHTD